MSSPIEVNLEVIGSQQQFELQINSLNQTYGIETETQFKPVMYPSYEGEVRITPRATAQVLPTKKRMVEEDIVVEAIPQNYGLITWNGSYLLIS